jgi:hypothetical protein
LIFGALIFLMNATMVQANEALTTSWLKFETKVPLGQDTNYSHNLWKEQPANGAQITRGPQLEQKETRQ